MKKKLHSSKSSKSFNFKNLKALSEVAQAASKENAKEIKKMKTIQKEKEKAKKKQEIEWNKLENKLNSSNSNQKNDSEHKKNSFVISMDEILKEQENYKKVSETKDQKSIFDVEQAEYIADQFRKHKPKKKKKTINLEEIKQEENYNSKLKFNTNYKKSKVESFYNSKMKSVYFDKKETINKYLEEVRKQALSIERKNYLSKYTTNKTTLTKILSKKTGLNTYKCKRSINAFFEIIEEALSDGNKINIMNFGTFYINKRADHKFTNPKTGKVSIVKSHNIPLFKASNKLKDLAKIAKVNKK